MKININMSQNVHNLVNRIHQVGGKPLVVGGSVRDTILGLAAKDIDIEVFGMNPGLLVMVLRENGNRVELVGKSFGVFKVTLADGETIDVSVPRRERKSGTGHKGFEVEADPDMSFDEASARRDFTINALAWDPFTMEVLDAHGGLRDLTSGWIRHTSKAFTEDPLRVLRAMRFAARFDMEVVPSTACLCNSLSDLFLELPRERVWGEFEGMLLKAIKPSRALQTLEWTDWLQHFPALNALVGVQQDPLWHPEGDAFTHTGLVMDAMAQWCRQHGIEGDERLILMLAALLHDTGKATTTVFGDDGRWHAVGHEEVSAEIAATFMQDMGVPTRFHQPVIDLVREHMVPHSWKNTPRKASVMKLAARVNLERLAALHAADRAGHGDPPSFIAMPEFMDDALMIAEVEGVKETPPPRLLTGKMLIGEGLMEPGKAMGEFLEKAFNAQLEGEFVSAEDALEWATNKLARGA